MHFTVGVITKEIGGYHRALEPFSEDADPKYLNFFEIETEGLKDYQNGEMEKIDRVNSEQPKVNKVAFTDIYKTFEEFMEKEYHLYSRDDVKGVYGYWRNPNSKYDGFKLGGRYRGRLLVKENLTDCNFAVPHFKSNNLEKDFIDGYKWVDTARIKDIEWKKMKEINEKIASQVWDSVMSSVEKDNLSKVILFIVNGIRETDTKKSFIKRETNFSTYSILTKEGVWLDNDTLPESISDKNVSNWEDNYMKRFIINSDRNLYLSIIDCHI